MLLQALRFDLVVEMPFRPLITFARAIAGVYPEPIGLCCRPSLLVLAVVPHRHLDDYFCLGYFGPPSPTCSLTPLCARS